MIADALYVGDTSVDRVMLGDVEVWSSAPSLPVVHITGTSGTVSQSQFRAACTAYGVAYNTVVTLPFLLDTSAATNMNSMFFGCSSLAQVPNLDTANVASMNSMFYGCSSLTRVPDLDTGSVTGMNSMFYGCSLLTRVPDLDTGSVTDMSSMFRDCPSLTQVPDLDTGSVTTMRNMFYNCSLLTQVPDLDTADVTDMRTMFYNCSALTDGNVRLIGKHPSVNTSSMIAGSGLTREPFYNTAGNPI